MSCRRIERLLSRERDGALSPREAAAVARHLADCPACRRRAATFAGIGEELRGLAESPMLGGSAARAVAAWRAEQVRKAPPRTRAVVWRPALASLALLGLLAALGTALLHRGQLTHGHDRLRATRIARIAPAPAPPGHEAPPAPDNTGAGTSRPVPAPSSPLPPVGEGSGVRSERSVRAQARPYRLRDNALARVPHPRPLQRGGPERGAADLASINADPAVSLSPWLRTPTDKVEALETRLERELNRDHEFLQIPFPRIASRDERAVAAAADAYRRQAAVLDPRLLRDVTLGAKATAFADLCRQLTAQTGVTFTAGRTVADDKVTVFCAARPVRDVMRQISRLFGFMWVRDGEEDDPSTFRYELIQDLHGQLLEEELRNRDRNAALLALDREMQRYRPYLGLSPQEAKQRAETAPPGDKEILKTLSQGGWAPAHLYFSLSADELGALRNGQALSYGAQQYGLLPQGPADGGNAGGPGAQSLPPEIAQGILSAYDFYRVSDQGLGTNIPGVAPAEYPGTRPTAGLTIGGNEPGQFTLVGESGFSLMKGDTMFGGMAASAVLATGISPSVKDPKNAEANAALARDPALRTRVTVAPQPSCRLETWAYVGGTPGPKVTTADVLEAVHRATGRDVIGDSFTHIYAPDEVSARDVTLFDALNAIGDAMHDRWSQDGGWLQFRSLSFFNDRLKEVPNRLLARWAADRQKNGVMPLEDLVEVSSLPTPQLHSRTMAEGARAVWGLQEWDYATNVNLQKHWQFLASLPPLVRPQAWSPRGLAFGQMPPALQPAFIALTFGPGTDLLKLTPDDLAGASLRVDYKWADPREQAAEKAWHGGRVPEPIRFVYTFGGPNTQFGDGQFRGTQRLEVSAYGAQSGPVNTPPVDMTVPAPG